MVGVRLWLWVGVRSGVDAGGWTALGQACGMSCLDSDVSTVSTLGSVSLG